MGIGVKFWNCVHILVCSWFDESAYAIAIVDHLSFCMSMALPSDHSFDHGDFLCGAYIGMLPPQKQIR